MISLCIELLISPLRISGIRTATTVATHGDLHTSKSLPRESQVNTGILLLNMGGPEKTDDVYDFLNRLFSDKDIIPLPAQK